MEALFTYLNSVQPLGEETVEFPLKNLKTKELSKREYLLKKGRVCDEMGFVETGLVRCYYEKDSQEVCTWFMKEGSFITSIWSFFKQIPSQEYVQALEPTVIYYITYDEYQFMCRQFPEFNFIVRVLLEQYYCLSEERTYTIRYQTAEERYRFLLDKHPEIIQRVPSAYIASYLDLSVWTLSRVRQKV